MLVSLSVFINLRRRIGKGKKLLMFIYYRKRINKVYCSFYCHFHFFSSLTCCRLSTGIWHCFSRVRSKGCFIRNGSRHTFHPRDDGEKFHYFFLISSALFSDGGRRIRSSCLMRFFNVIKFYSRSPPKNIEASVGAYPRAFHCQRTRTDSCLSVAILLDVIRRMSAKKSDFVA